MTGEAALIAAFSARSLAQSARRAGYVPLVADAFGDEDMADAAHGFRIIDGAMRTGFRAKPLIAALDALVAAAPTRPIGLVLGSGLEDKPRLVEILDRRYKLLGCSVGALRACKDPNVFFPLLDRLGIAHPETRTTPPVHSDGWLTKRIGGSGGRHVRRCSAHSRAKPRRYFQRHIDGKRLSMSAVVADGMIMDTTLNMTRQWCAPTTTHPFRYGGAVSLPWSGTAAESEMVAAMSKLSQSIKLKGLVSFDFVVADDTPFLLEVNPRPGASLDVMDDAEGSRFHAHVIACRGVQHSIRAPTAGQSARAAAVLHADRGDVTLGSIGWPNWAADRGKPGTRVARGQPLATVFADGPTADAAEALARARLVELESLIYETAKV